MARYGHSTAVFSALITLSFIWLLSGGHRLSQRVYGLEGGGKLINIQGLSTDRGARYLSQQGWFPATVTRSSFVRRVGSKLHLSGAPYSYSGFNTYYMLQKASDHSTLPLVTDALDLAQKLGMTVMRTWAFSDGASQFRPLQPELGQVDSAILKRLDHVLHEAQKRNIRVILTLSNYFADYGGIQQYVEWTNASNASTVRQFYQDKSIQDAYKDFVTAVILHKNSVSGVLYRDDPMILAWDLCNEPANPGDESGDMLHDWLDMMSTYVKSVDPNHLVYYGAQGFFGASSPEWVHLNNNYSGEYTPYAAVRWDTACQGEDWTRNIALPNVDLASYHLWPGNTPNEAATTHARLQAHMDAATAANKPLVIDEFNEKRPYGRRNAFLDQVFSLVNQAGSPVVGTNVWMLSADGYPDYDQNNICASEAAAAQPLPPGPALNAEWAVTLARQAIFRGFVAADACVRRRYEGNKSSSSPYVGGLSQTLDILSMHREKHPGQGARPHQHAHSHDK